MTPKEAGFDFAIRIMLAQLFAHTALGTDESTGFLKETTDALTELAETVPMDGRDPANIEMVRHEARSVIDQTLALARIFSGAEPDLRIGLSFHIPKRAPDGT